MLEQACRWACIKCIEGQRFMSVFGAYTIMSSGGKMLRFSSPRGGLVTKLVATRVVALPSYLLAQGRACVWGTNLHVGSQVSLIKSFCIANCICGFGPPIYGALSYHHCFQPSRLEVDGFGVCHVLDTLQSQSNVHQAGTPLFCYSVRLEVYPICPCAHMVIKVFQLLGRSKLPWH